MNPTILFRRGIDDEHEEEFRIAQRFFPVVERRSLCPGNSLIIGRFSTLPFYEELSDDLKAIGSRLINDPAQHRWIANMEWLRDLEGFTFRTWNDDNFHRAPEGAYVLKGRTNSRKSHWDTHMFAPNKRAAIDVAGRLLADPLIAQQGLVYREYVPLVTYEIGINGQRFTNEWRFFYFRDQRLAKGHYWTTATNPDLAEMDEFGLDFVRGVSKVACQHAQFYVLDIAKKEDGDWILVEVNEGQQAGLSAIHPAELYCELAEAVRHA